MEEKKILAISASPRKNANVDMLLKMALEEAEKLENINTELVCLRDYHIENCSSCFACCNEVAKDRVFPCLAFNDDMNLLYPKLKECDGLLIGTPVYFGSMAAQLKAFMDRTECLLRYSKSKWKDTLSNKVGAGLVVGGNRNGGQEFTLQSIHYYYFIHNMIVVGTGPEPTPGCYLGGSATTYPEKGASRNAVLQDELGIKSSKMVGKRIAEVLNMTTK